MTGALRLASGAGPALVDDEPAASLDGETFTQLVGRVVPYGQWTNVGLFHERFEFGAFTRSLVEVEGQVPLLLFHDNASFPIGMGVSWDERADGLWGTFRLASTSRAQAAALYARDEFLVGMSVGFVPQVSSWEYVDAWDPDNGVLDRVTRTRARLLEVSLTPTPAYAGAGVSEVMARSVDRPYRSVTRQLRAWVRADRRMDRG